jgi:hypothetical protein
MKSCPWALGDEVNMLESQKAKATNDILKLNRTIDQMQANMQNRGERAYEPAMDIVR